MDIKSEQEKTASKKYEDIYIARQPVFDSSMNLWAYEILYRDRLLAQNAIFVDDLLATLKVLSALPLCMELNAEKSIIIINFPSQAIIDQIQEVYPAPKTIVQLTDTRPAEKELVKAITSLKQAGYRFSIDNFQNIPSHQNLYALSDYFSIDFLNQKNEKIEQMVSICKTRFPHSALIAHKVEEYDDYLFAKNLGFKYFQGYFFKRPKVQSGRVIPTSTVSKLKILKLLQKDDVEFKEISKAIITDVSIVHRLMVYINSPGMGLRKRINSVDEALVIMGLNPLKKWLQIIILTDMKPMDKPHELVLLSAQRAYFLELMALRHNFKEIKDQLFLLGLFSLIDSILDYSKEVLLPQLSMITELEDALLGKPSDYLLWIELIDHCESANWPEVEQTAGKLRIHTKGLSKTYEEAYLHAKSFF